MGQHAQPARGPRRRAWLSTIALTATLPLAVALPAVAQEEVDPMEVMRLEFDACIASGVDGSECAATAKARLEAIMSGDTSWLDGGEEAAADGVSGNGQINSSSGEDGQVSNGGDQGLSDDAAPGDESAPATETAPAPPAEGTTPTDGAMTTEGATSDPSTAPAPAQTPTAAGSTTTTSTTTDSGTTTGTSSTLSGGAQTNDASGTDGRRRDR